MTNEMNNKGSDDFLLNEVQSGRDIDQSGTVSAGSMLLTASEEEVIIRISAGDSIHSQRAKALLAIHEGASQAQAGEQTGLTRGQVRYWLERFRDQRLDIFPMEILQEAGGAAQAAGSEPELAEQPPEKVAESSKKAGKKKTGGKKPKKSKKLTRKQKSKKKKSKLKKRDKKKKKKKTRKKKKK